MRIFVIILSICFSFPAKSQVINFSCEEMPEGTIWCDDFEDGIPLNEKYFESGDDDGDFIVMDPASGVSADANLSSLELDTSGLSFGTYILLINNQSFVISRY